MPSDGPFGCVGLAACPATPCTLFPSALRYRNRKASLGKKTFQGTQRIRESMTKVRKETLAKGYWRLALCGQDVQIGRKFTQVEPDGDSVSQL